MKFTPSQKKLLFKYSANADVNNEWYVDSGKGAVVLDTWDLERLPDERIEMKKPLPLKDYYNLFIISFEYFLSLKGPENLTKEEHYASTFGEYFEALNSYKKYSNTMEEKARRTKSAKYRYKKVEYAFGDLFSTMLNMYRNKCSKKKIK